MHFAEASTGTGKILSSGIYRPSVHLAEAGDDTVGIDLFFVQAKQGRTVLYKKLYFLKRILVVHAIQPFPGRQFAKFMLLGDHFITAHFHQGFFSGLKCLNFCLRSLQLFLFHNLAVSF